MHFVTRMKKNVVFEVIEVKRTHYRKKEQFKILSDEIIELEYNPEDEQGEKNLKETRKLLLRGVRYQDDKNRHNEFLTNNFGIKAEEVAFLLKKDGALNCCLIK